MIRAEEIVHLMYGRSIRMIDWNVFSRTLSIVTDGNHSSKLILKGVHLCSFRQSLLGPESPINKEDDPIYVLDLTQDHLFLKQWIEKIIAFSADVMIYDTTGLDNNDARFIRPWYLYLVCSSGYLDVIFESWELDTK